MGEDENFGEDVVFQKEVPMSQVPDVSRCPAAAFLAEISSDPGIPDPGNRPAVDPRFPAISDPPQPDPTSSGVPLPSQPAATGGSAQQGAFGLAQSNLNKIQSYNSLMKLIREVHVREIDGSFMCSFCYKTFKKGKVGKTNASKHVLMNHFEDDLYFSCPVCDHACNNRAILKRHLEEKHEKKLSMWQLDAYKKKIENL